MSPEIPSKPTKLCPTCGTRVSADATHCLVCGANLAVAEKKQSGSKPVQGSRMPEITLSLPAILGFFTLFLAIGAGMVYFAMIRSNPTGIEPTLTPTVTSTITPSITPTEVTPTITNTPEPSPTPFTYKVATGDTCSSIAYAFGISINAVVLQNDLPAACDTLYVGQSLLIPQPTPTASPMPTATLSALEATEAACTKIDYQVQDNDTLSSISANYNVPITVLKTYNGLVNDTVRSGQTIVIPLCERFATPGPSPTPTIPPPYPAPVLLLPPDGEPYLTSDQVISLQWAAIGTLRDNEAYQITIMDITDGSGRKLVDYVLDTKYVVPTSFRPGDSRPHVIRWWVNAARQTGTDDNGNPIWDTAGVSSDYRDFIWIGSTQPGVTPTP
ncbi:MAG: LysM peptidoglycan-binding domain-containing protein [Anaerolineales bacterium]|nr:LysM peptidoglycan-binding domain-containing protein [Anaerolineales bacterium]